MARWNSTYPPAYKYEGITAPVALFWGQNDWLVVPEDVAVLAEELPNWYGIRGWRRMLTHIQTSCGECIIWKLWTSVKYPMFVTCEQTWVIRKARR